ncbi:uncharacterized protein DUF559 [Hydrogenispora ethanolica]|uniref:Uncharacterized protein DUF559 n=1 Tax=Hydrogenispora ethanolica TaxID=1082276 RepID=A0A4V2QG25_HYDET|nr:DUF559 domain-containing protein [Hydrogenispora ethanolica]TCL74207.1 uncharacterized protein DUF559 [Hydrogenispora ethanolica]
MEFTDMLNTFDPEIQQHMLGLFFRDMLIYKAKLQKCESPIEKLFALYFLYGEREQGFGDSAMVLIEPQYEIHLNSTTYRVDFLISVQISGQFVRLIVECDGHDFHERTKAQARYDRRRERRLKASGYEVIRFTGSEIVADPYKCVTETMELMKQMALNNTAKCINQ